MKKVTLIMIASVLILGLTHRDGYAHNPSTVENRFGFSLYSKKFGKGRDDPRSDSYIKMKAIHAGWVQAEDPASFSASWGDIFVDMPESGNSNDRGDGIIDASEFADADWSSLDWVIDASNAGMNILLTINLGHNDPQKEHYSTWVHCSISEPLDYNNSCPPKNDNAWQSLYDYVYALVKRFDGSTPGVPEIRYFHTQSENNSAGYWTGTVDEYYGNKGQGTTLYLYRKGEDNYPIEEFPRAILPIIYQALNDANSKAKLVVGASSEGQGYASAHLFHIASNFSSDLCSNADYSDLAGSCNKKQCSNLSEEKLDALIEIAEKYLTILSKPEIFCFDDKKVCRCRNIIGWVNSAVSVAKREFFNYSLNTRINSAETPTKPVLKNGEIAIKTRG